jgi:hypothetical protein
MEGLPDDVACMVLSCLPDTRSLTHFALTSRRLPTSDVKGGFQSAGEYRHSCVHAVTVVADRSNTTHGGWIAPSCDCACAHASPAVR